MLLYEVWEECRLLISQKNLIVTYCIEVLNERFNLNFSETLDIFDGLMTLSLDSKLCLVLIIACPPEHEEGQGRVLKKDLDHWFLSDKIFIRYIVHHNWKKSS